MKSMLLVTAMFIGSCAFADELKVVLSYKEKVAGDVIKTVELLSNNIDPNGSSADEIFQLRIDGVKKTNIPKDVLANLNANRRSISYDSLSGGIEHTNLDALCRIGGSSSGAILEARYLEYQNYRIVDDAMKTVYAEAYNCLFDEVFFPKKDSARVDAAQIMAIMRTILAYDAQ